MRIVGSKEPYPLHFFFDRLTVVISLYKALTIFANCFSPNASTLFLGSNEGLRVLMSFFKWHHTSVIINYHIELCSPQFNGIRAGFSDRNGSFARFCWPRSSFLFSSPLLLLQLLLWILTIVLDFQSIEPSKDLSQWALLWIM
jgi:hypothetical protein